MASAKITLILGSHAHVPYGADTAEFENVYLNHVRPFVSSLCKYPRISAALHYSGVLLHWIERNHPGLFMSIEEMIARKQIDILGGGFYDPMLPLLPLQDKIGQIELLTTYIRKQFGKRPQGCWIPSFAWEQSLVSPLAACGMGFTFLSERQFALANGAATNACVCEDQGKLITVFPVLQSLETAIAEKNAALVLENFSKKQPAGAETLVSIFPQKINVAKNESMDSAWSRFFEDIARCEPFVETISPGKLCKNLGNLPKRYFPDSSACTEGMSPRRFIITHPEAGGIYAKMIFTNVLINQLRGDKSRKLSAHEELWKAQGNALFCRTGQQGLHNHLLRSAAYSALLRAEQITREKSKFVPSLVPFDFNMDGAEEWLFQDSKINCYVQSLGGGIFELDYLPRAWNYLDTCDGRFAFADRLLPAGTTPEKLVPGAVDAARLCRNERYEISNLDKVRRKLSLVLRPAAASIPFGNIEMVKTYSVKKDTVSAGYTFTNQGGTPVPFQFAPEIDLALPGKGDTCARFFISKAGAETPLTQSLLRGIDSLKIHDLKNEVHITLTASRSFNGKLLPLCIPDPQTGAELYQAYCIMPCISLSLKPGETQELEFTLKFSH
ncbi:MAG: DUF1926 domain-containing protein [Treponema sp.]|nr:DUF1926 domain-containing protein [Treponema sp.]